MKSRQATYLRNAARCSAKIGKETCNLPPSAHGIDTSRINVEVSHSFVLQGR